MEKDAGAVGKQIGDGVSLIGRVAELIEWPIHLEASQQLLECFFLLSLILYYNLKFLCHSYSHLPGFFQYYHLHLLFLNVVNHVLLWHVSNLWLSYASICFTSGRKRSNVGYSCLMFPSLQCCFSFSN